ncbi:MAG: NAD(P)-dependent glycerol-3-phosphate dehydrogenase [Deltaproteobacteria bacterium]|nr:NAD(P)-dependent glycerol-3-phosphate dehydrogenase [Deltaproteobacteria bacterium]
MTESLRITVLGAGHWGTALAQHLAMREHNVTLWAYESEVVTGINQQHRNPLFLKEALLSERIVATNEISEAIIDAKIILFVIPAQLIRKYLVKLRGKLQVDVPVVICSKGIERRSLATMDQVCIEELPASYHANICVLSGPSFAAEVAKGVPTNLTLAARDNNTAKLVQNALATKGMRVYTTDDLVGVELGGALKNVIAIAIGACVGLGFGLNTQAGFITRGLSEVTRLTMAMHGRPETMLGLAGVGDLILTCTGELSRNRQVGKLLAQGRQRADIESEMRMVAEGIPTAESAYELAQKYNVDVPIIEQVYRVLYKGISVIEAMEVLQSRSLKEEWGN